jgi:hypothetical protein
MQLVVESQAAVMKCAAYHYLLEHGLPLAVSANAIGLRLQFDGEESKWNLEVAYRD